MIKKNNKKIYAENMTSTTDAPDCEGLQIQYCDKLKESDLAEAAYIAAINKHQDEFILFIDAKQDYNDTRARWFTANNASEKAKKYLKDNPNNQDSANADLNYIGGIRREKTRLRNQFPNNEAELKKKFDAIDLESTAIFGPPPPYQPAGLIRDIRQLKNKEKIVDDLFDKMIDEKKKYQKLDKELKKIEESIKDKKPACPIPNCNKRKAPLK
jgi:hypothetical protein